MVHANAMGDFVGAIEDPDKRRQGKLCVKCGSLKSDVGDLCQQCTGAIRAAARAVEAEAKRLRIRRERQKRFEAALEAGWTLAELYRGREYKGDDPLPTWEEILRRAPDVVIRRWWNSGS